MSSQIDGRHFGVRHLETFAVSLLGCLSADTQTRFRLGVPDEFEHDVKGANRNSGPLTTERTEQSVFNRIPFRRSGRVVAKRHFQIEGVSQTLLKVAFEKPGTAIVTASCIRQDQQAVGLGVICTTLGAPPVTDRIGREFGCVRRRADIHKTMIPRDVVNAIRSGNALGVLPEIVGIDLHSGITPSAAGVLEVADKFLFLGIHADYGQSRLLERFFGFLDIGELPVAVRVRWSGKAFAVGLQRMPLFFNRVRMVAWLMACPFRFMAFCNSRRLWRTQVSLEPGSPAMSWRISSSKSLSRERSFCVKVLRPAPWRRWRAGGQSSNSWANSWRPVRIVFSSMPVISERRRIPPWPNCNESRAINQRRWFSSIRSRTRPSDRRHGSSSIQGVVSAPIGKTRIFFHDRSMLPISA